MKRIVPPDIPLSEFHSYLIGAVAPRPIALASTIDKEGRPNLSPFSFFNAFGSNPPVIIFSPARAGRTGLNKNTYDNIREIPEVVINVVTYPMVHQVSLASAEYPKGVDEFEKSGLTPIPSERVRPFRVKESPVQMECKVINSIETGTKGGAGNLVIAEIVLMHIDETILGDDGTIDPDKIDLVSRMGGDWYCRASGNALFRLPAPKGVIGMGVNAIPVRIRQIGSFSGKELSQLGSIPHLPEPSEVNEYRQNVIAEIKKNSNHETETENLLILKIKGCLERDQIREAWKIILVLETMHDHEK